MISVDIKGNPHYKKYLSKKIIYLSKSIGSLFSVCAERCCLLSQPIFNVTFTTELSFIRALL